MTRNMWGQVRERLLSEIGQNHYRNWIEPLELNGLDDGVATFVVPTNFVGNWVQRNYGDRIMRHMSAFEPVSRLEFTVAPAGRAPAGPSAVDAGADEVAQAVGTQVKWESEELPGAPLDPRFTFDSFVVGKPNQLAHAAARRVAEGGPVTFNPLFLYGGVGLGKTHLMHAIAWEIQARNPALKVVYLSAEQFMYRFVQALREKQMMDFKHLFRTVDVLMVDDVQFIAGKDS
ncbi:MAG: ATP-binding protein, partial [Maritimibacter sp.]|nr:ATP-binding protein [Maritimibacter sp.]